MNINRHAISALITANIFLLLACTNPPGSDGGIEVLIGTSPIASGGHGGVAFPTVTGRDNVMFQCQEGSDLESGAIWSSVAQCEMQALDSNPDNSVVVSTDSGSPGGVLRVVLMRLP